MFLNLVIILSSLSESDIFGDILKTPEISCYISGWIYEPEWKIWAKNCVYYYSDAGKSCDNSNECEGDCVVIHPDNPVWVCKENDSEFWCFSVIEDFKKDWFVLCVD